MGREGVSLVGASLAQRALNKGSPTPPQVFGRQNLFSDPLFWRNNSDDDDGTICQIPC